MFGIAPIRAIGAKSFAKSNGRFAVVWRRARSQRSTNSRCDSTADQYSRLGSAVTDPGCAEPANESARGAASLERLATAACSKIERHSPARNNDHKRIPQK